MTIRALTPWLTALALAAGFAGVSCKKSPVKLSANECQSFCKKSVGCRPAEIANGSKAEDLRSCIAGCKGKDGQQYNFVLRAMKRCGHHKDCKKLNACQSASISGK